MTEEEWLSAETPEVLMRYWLRMLEEGSPRKRRLFAVSCCRRIAEFLHHDGHEALRLAEGYADACEKRSAMVRAGQRIRNKPSFETSDEEGAMDYARRAVGEACQPGIMLDPFRVLSWISCLTESDPSLTRRQQIDQTELVRDIFGNPFRSISFDVSWRTSTVVAIAQQMYETRDFSAMPILADALQDAGCVNEDILSHCRAADGVHVRGCWAVDRVLDKS